MQESDVPSADKTPDTGIGEMQSDVQHGDVTIAPRFGFWALLGYQMMVMASWSNYLVTIGVSVDVGGSVGFLYGTLVVGLFMEFTAVSLAELASIWPHPGGPLYWVGKLAPGSSGAAASFFMGWMNILAYITSTASASFSSTQTLTALITQIYGYEWPRYQMCFVSWAFTLSFVPISLYPKVLPAWSIAAFVTLIATLIVTIGLWASHIQPQSPQFVFTSFSNNTGWSSNGLVFLLSLVQTTFAMSGLDAATHLSFETKSPRKTIPLVLVSSIAVSTVLCFAFAILLLFALGPLDALVNSSLGAIYLQLYVNSAGTGGGLAIATIIMLSLNLFCGVQLVSANARVIWTMARRNWSPFSSYLSRINPRTEAPVNATMFSAALSLLLGLLYVAGDSAWNAIASCVVGAFQLTYIGPIILLLYRGRSVLPSRGFSLDRWPLLGYVVNIGAIAWGLGIFILSLFPVYLPVTGTSMNYSIVVFAVWAVVLIPFWFLYARYQTSSSDAEQTSLYEHN